jgi:hypothetical protein
MRGVSLEEAAGHLLRGALDRDAAIAAGLQALDDLEPRPDRLPHEETEALALQEQEAMRRSGVRRVVLDLNVG